MASRFRTLTNFFISIVLAGVLLYVAFRGTNVNVLWEIIKNVKFWWVLTAFPLLILSHYVRAWRWQLLLVPVKNRVERRNAFSSLLIGYMTNNIVPRVGEIVRPYILARLESISKASTFGSVFIERMIDLISLLLGIGLLFVLFQKTLMDQFPWWRSFSILALTITGVFIIGISLLIYKRYFMLRIAKIFLFPFSDRVKERGEEIFHSFVDGMMIIRQRDNIVSIIALTVVMWMLYMLTAYLPLLAFDLEDSPINLLTGFVLTMVTSLSVIIPTPGGTGSYHTFTVEMLTRLYGIQREVALGYATLTHAVGYFSVIFVGLYYVISLKLKVKDFLEQVETDEQTESEESAERHITETKKEAS
jgi:glycosyltransferase 2 family protein